MSAIRTKSDSKAIRRGFDTRARLKLMQRGTARRASGGWVDIAPGEKVLDVRFMTESEDQFQMQIKSQA